MIIISPDQLPNIKNEHLVVDVETTSFDDKVEAFNCFQGHRIAGFAFGTLDKDSSVSYYLPIRHWEGNFNFKNAIKYMKDIIESAKSITNHNIKFDAKFWRKDGINDTCPLIDTMVLGRLVKNDFFDYKLETLVLYYLKKYKKDAAKQWCNTNKTKDYGKIPVEIIGPDACNDIDITRELYHELMKQLKLESNRIWQTEIALTSILLKSEYEGVDIDLKRIKRVSYIILKRIMEISEKLNEIAGEEINPGSKKDITEILVNRLGFQPVTYTKPSVRFPNGQVQWTTENLKLLRNPIANLFAEYSHLTHFYSTYCEGFENRIGDDNKLHTDFQQSGALTGRLSSRGPNLQNLPPEAIEFLLARQGEILLKFDYSQIEYRIFGHYANDENIINQYITNVNTDFHQRVADMLNCDRGSAKTMNFGLLYGKGKKKLLKEIIDMMIDNPELDLSKYGSTPEEIASNFYNAYHNKIPSLRQLNNRVQNKINTTKELRNYLGRFYYFEYDEQNDRIFNVYAGLNYLCQGTAADIFKDRMVFVCNKYKDLHLLSNIHDALYWSCDKDYTIEIYDELKHDLENLDPPMRIPIVATGEVSIGNLGASVEVKESIEQALLESEKVEPWKWEFGDLNETKI